VQQPDFFSLSWSKRFLFFLQKQFYMVFLTTEWIIFWILWICSGACRSGFTDSHPQEVSRWTSFLLRCWFGFSLFIVTVYTAYLWCHEQKNSVVLLFLLKICQDKHIKKQSMQQRGSQFNCFTRLAKSTSTSYRFKGLITDTELGPLWVLEIIRKWKTCIRMILLREELIVYLPEWYTRKRVEIWGGWFWTHKQFKPIFTIFEVFILWHNEIKTRSRPRWRKWNIESRGGVHFVLSLGVAWDWEVAYYLP
jgi:hypothetical protein